MLEDVREQCDAEADGRCSRCDGWNDISFSWWVKHLLYVARRPCVGAPWEEFCEASPKTPWFIAKARHAAGSVEVQGWGKVRFRVALEARV
jgi:hypothetical protein